MAPPGSSPAAWLEEWPQARLLTTRGKKVSLAAFQDKAKVEDFFVLCELGFFLYIAIPCYSSGNISVPIINLFVWNIPSILYGVLTENNM